MQRPRSRRARSRGGWEAGQADGPGKSQQASQEGLQVGHRPRVSGAVGNLCVAGPVMAAFSQPSFHEKEDAPRAP